jgi:hypothetical protein
MTHLLLRRLTTHYEKKAFQTFNRRLPPEMLMLSFN